MSYTKNQTTKRGASAQDPRVDTHLLFLSGKLRAMSDDLLWLIVVAGLLAGFYKIWQLAMDARETANRIARETCSRALVQFLDETVAFAGFRLRRDAQGRRQILRTYTFDYTGDGVARAQGFIVLARGRLEAVGLAGGAP